MVLAGGLTFVAMGSGMVRQVDPFTVAVGVIGIGFFSLCSAYALVRLVRPSVAVVVDAEGIVDRASALGVGRLMWEEIEHAYVYDFLGQTMLGIVPRDLDAILLRQPWWRRRLLRRNAGLGCAPVNIPEIMLPVSAQVVLSAMYERWPPRARGEAGPG
jgi:hypothetical protein